MTGEHWLVNAPLASNGRIPALAALHDRALRQLAPNSSDNWVSYSSRIASLQRFLELATRRVPASHRAVMAPSSNAG
ncbi:hypothetical protein D3C84_907010 [compost metagenome]